MKDGKKIKFPIPAGYQVPEGIKDGQTFDESCTFKLEGDKLCLIAMNGVTMPGYEEEAEQGQRAAPDAPQPPADLASRYAAAMAGGGGGE